jgi:hypothetical protein
MKKDGKLDADQEKIVKAAQERAKMSEKLSEEEKERTKELIKQANSIYNQRDALKE